MIHFKSAERLLKFMNGTVIPDLENCEFIMNMKKYMSAPAQEAKYLGMIIDTIMQCIRVPLAKKRKSCGPVLEGTK